MHDKREKDGMGRKKEARVRKKKICILRPIVRNPGFAP